MSIADRGVDPARPAERRRRPRPRSSARPRGSTSSRYSAPCCLEELPARHRDDARLRRPSRRAGRARRARSRPRRRSRRAPRRASRRRRARTRRGAGPTPARARVRSSIGTFWRESTRQTGPLRAPRGSTRHASAASFASAGRITVSFGIARIAARCSTGWCVGPSSPTATESWVKIQTHVELHQRREPDRRAHVVGEDEERRAERLHDPAVQREAVDRRAHAVLAHAPGDVAAGVLGREVGARPRTR